MSLDIYLTVPREKSRAEQAIDLLRANGFDDFADELYARHSEGCGHQRVFSLCISSRLADIAKSAGIYAYLWNPESFGMSKARDMIDPLYNGIEWLDIHQDAAYKAAKSCWGSPAVLKKILRAYIAACEEYPDADIEVSR